MPSAPEAPPCLLCGRRLVLVSLSVPNGASVESRELARTIAHLFLIEARGA